MSITKNYRIQSVIKPLCVLTIQCGLKCMSKSYMTVKESDSPSSKNSMEKKKKRTVEI